MTSGTAAKRTRLGLLSMLALVIATTFALDTAEAKSRKKSGRKAASAEVKKSKKSKKSKIAKKSKSKKSRKWKKVKANVSRLDQILAKYDRKRQKMEARHLREEDRMISRTEDSDSHIERRENIRAMASRHRLEKEEMEWKMNHELCTRARTHCDKVGMLTAAEEANTIPAFARDAGFRYE